MRRDTGWVRVMGKTTGNAFDPNWDAADPEWGRRAGDIGWGQAPEPEWGP